MTELMTTLVLVVYVIAGLVGVQLATDSLSRLIGAGRMAARHGLVRDSLSAAGRFAVLLAGLFLAFQGAAVVIWTFS